MNRLLVEASLVVARCQAQLELDRWLGGPTREHHYRADWWLDRIDRLGYVLAEWEREAA